LVFPITYYPLPITGLHRYDKSSNGHDITYLKSYLMKTQMSQRKASKGTVQIKNSNERLQLVFSYTEKRHYLSTGFTHTPANRKLAEMKARQIELDILSGNFDPTLAKYKPESLLSTVTPTTLPPKITRNVEC
jgi:hypothetical protein